MNDFPERCLLKQNFIDSSFEALHYYIGTYILLLRLCIKDMLFRAVAVGRPMGLPEHSRHTYMSLVDKTPLLQQRGSLLGFVFVVWFFILFCLFGSLTNSNGFFTFKVHPFGYGLHSLWSVWVLQAPTQRDIWELMFGWPKHLHSHQQLFQTTVGTAVWDLGTWTLSLAPSPPS